MQRRAATAVTGLDTESKVKLLDCIANAKAAVIAREGRMGTRIIRLRATQETRANRSSAPSVPSALK
jgi:hypothetical protein